MTEKKNKKVKPGSLSRLFSYLFKYKLGLIISIIGVLASSIYQVKGLNLLQPIIDNYILKGDLPGLKSGVLTMATFYIISVLATFLYSRIMVRIGEKSIRDLRNDLFGKIQRLPIEFFDRTPHGDVMSRFTNDTDMLSFVYTDTIPSIIRSLLIFVGTFAIMIKIDYRLTLITVVTIFLIILVLRKLIKKIRILQANTQKEIGRLQSFNEEMLNGQKVIKVFNHEELSKERFNQISDHVKDESTAANVNAGKMMPFLVNGINITYAIICMVGIFFTINGSLSVGSLVTYLSNLRILQNPIQNLTQQSGQIFQALAGADRIFEIIDLEDEKDGGYIELVHAKVTSEGIEESDQQTGKFARKWEEDGKTVYKELEGRIDFDHVNFSYDGKNKILKDITFYVEPGQKLALVGSTGAGKTTITNVITRFYDIDSGEIRIDNIDIRKIKKEDLRRAFGMVLQDVDLFTTTVEENIRYGKLDAGDDEVRAAARLTNADSFIQRLEEGYKTVIHGDGSSLSDGQNQLVSISRAAIDEPSMLILDEATSSIDTATEMKVTEAMGNLMLGSTSVVIAHRLSTIKNSDVIMVMEHGRIIERGNHDQLMAKHGTYYQLYTGQLELD